MRSIGEKLTDAGLTLTTVLLVAIGRHVPLWLGVLVGLARAGFPLLVELDAERALAARARALLPSSAVDLVRLRLALDASALEALRPIVTGLLVSRPDDHARRSELLRQLAAALLADRAAWRYASIDDFVPVSARRAERRFADVVRDVRAWHRAGAAADDARLVLLTLVVSSRREIPDVQASTASAVRRVLRQLSTVERQELVALHLTCAPSPDGPSTSTAALEAAHPELRRIAGHE